MIFAYGLLAVILGVLVLVYKVLLLVPRVLLLVPRMMTLSTTGPISISTSTSIGHQTSDHENEQEISSVHSESDEYNSSYDETCSLQTPPYSPVL